MRNLEAFCKELQSKGIELVVPYRYSAELKLGIAQVRDPWAR